MPQETTRIKLTEEQAEKFLAKFLSDRGLSTQAANKYVRLIAAKRLAALHRFAAGAHLDKPLEKAPAKKASKKASKVGAKASAKKSASKKIQAESVAAAAAAAA